MLLVRYHDHTRVFPLPAPLRRALQRRVAALNTALVAETGSGVGLLDLDRLPGSYDPATWSIDRLHPSERGHRILARGLAALLSDAGFAVPRPVLPSCGGGRRVSALHRAAWLVFKGLPWLVRRGRDLGPVILAGLLSGALRSERAALSGAPRSERTALSGAPRSERTALNELRPESAA